MRIRGAGGNFGGKNRQRVATCKATNGEKTQPSRWAVARRVATKPGGPLESGCGEKKGERSAGRGGYPRTRNSGLLPLKGRERGIIEPCNQRWHSRELKKGQYLSNAVITGYARRLTKT